MTRIGGGGHKPPPDTASSVSQAQNTAEQTKEANTKEARKSQNQGVSDQFELASKLNKLAGQKGVARTQFSNA